MKILIAVLLIAHGLISINSSSPSTQQSDKE